MNHGASRFRRRAAAALAGALLLVPFVGLESAQANDPTDPNDPSFWPVESTEINPDLDTLAHALRAHGGQRNTTNFATGLLMTGDEDYPFDNSADRNNDGAANLNGTNA